MDKVALNAIRGCFSTPRFALPRFYPNVAAAAMIDMESSMSRPQLTVRRKMKRCFIFLVHLGWGAPRFDPFMLFCQAEEPVVLILGFPQSRRTAR
ncbi:hypothetical protein [Noviherbaspirillum humi]|uniref:hypothetical protein n=1 Tax=Noviherbaspirillum humi TaxID=1688639 RepID=UPI00116086D6|nr:hypothetical protein [Noviherbaspirillum humi]